MKWAKVTPNLQLDESFEGFYWVTFKADNSTYVEPMVWRNGEWWNAFYIDNPIDDPSRAFRRHAESCDHEAIYYMPVARPKPAQVS